MGEHDSCKILTVNDHRQEVARRADGTGEGM